jgi:hypothetical protein
VAWRFDLLPGLIYLDETGGGGGGGTCANSPQLLCRTGRAGTANNALISLDADGQITGSGDDAHGLVLRSSSGVATTSPFGVSLVVPTEIGGAIGDGNMALVVHSQPLTLNMNGLYFENVGDGKVWTIKSGATGISFVTGWSLGAEIRNAPGEAQTASLISIFEDVTAITADGALLTVGNAITVVGSFPTWRTVAGGTLHIANATTVDTEPSIGVGVTVDSLRAMNFAPGGSGTVGDLIGFDYTPGGGLVVTGVRATLRSVDPLAALLHSGPATFGDATHAGLVKVESGTGTEMSLVGGPSGTIFGTTLAGAPGLFQGLILNATTSADLLVNPIHLNANTTSITGPGIFLAFGFLNSTITINDDPGVTGQAADVTGFTMGGNWVIGDDSLGGMKIDFFQLNPTITNPTGVAKHLASAITVYENTAVFTADSAPCTIDNYRHSLSSPTFQTIGGGTITFANTVTGYDHSPMMDAGVTAPANVGYRHTRPQGGGNIVDDIAFFADVGGIATVSGIWASLRSSEPGRQLRHAGPGVFGADASPTGVYFLEVIGDAHITGKLTVDGLIDPPQVVIDNNVAQPPFVIQHAVNVPNLDADLLDGQHAAAFAAAADLATLTTTVAGKALATRNVATTGPLAGGGDLSADRTLTIAKATASVDGYLAAADFTTFTAKAGLTDTKTLSAQSAAAGPTNFANTATSGLYAIFYTLRCSTADALAVGIVTVTFAWNDGTGARTVVSGNVAITALTAIASGVVGLIRLGSGNITYQTAITASLGTGKYDLDATLVRVG